MQEKEIDGKAIWSYGNPEAEKVLIQLVGEHEITGTMSYLLGKHHRHLEKKDLAMVHQSF